jgi:hypothetical protein
MLQRISVSSTNNGEKSTKLGQFEFTAGNAAVSPGVIGIQGAELTTPKGAKLTLHSSYALTNCNLSVTVLADGVQMFMGAAHWDKVTPYFSFRITTGELVHLHFQRIEKNDPKKG